MTGLVGAQRPASTRPTSQMRARKQGARRAGAPGRSPRLAEKMASLRRRAAGAWPSRGGAPGPAGRSTCFRGSCRDSSDCWAAAPLSAPRRSHPPRCSPAPCHPHPAIPARRGASRRPPGGPVSPANRSPAAVQSSLAGLVRPLTLVHLRSAGFPGFGGEEADLERLSSPQGVAGVLNYLFATTSSSSGLTPFSPHSTSKRLSARHVEKIKLLSYLLSGLQTQSHTPF